MATIKEVKECLDSQFHGYFLKEEDGNNQAQYVVKINEREIPILFEEDHIRIPSNLEMNYEQADVLSVRYYLYCVRTTNRHCQSQEILDAAANFGYVSSELYTMFYDTISLDKPMSSIYDALCKDIHWLHRELKNIEATVYNSMLAKLETYKGTANISIP